MEDLLMFFFFNNKEVVDSILIFKGVVMVMVGCIKLMENMVVVWY